MEIDDEYVPGIRATEMAAVLYAGFHGDTPEASPVVKATWSRTLACAKSDCGEVHEYRSGDLLLFED